jgi:hypothetical protein
VVRKVVRRKLPVPVLDLDRQTRGYRLFYGKKCKGPYCGLEKVSVPDHDTAFRYNLPRDVLTRAPKRVASTLAEIPTELGTHV